jgi:hypothetical protein
MPRHWLYINSSSASAPTTVYYYQNTAQTTSVYGLGNQTSGYGLGSQTATATANAFYYVGQDSVWIDGNTVAWEDWVDQSQYVALAQQRAVMTLAEAERMQREADEREMRLEADRAAAAAIYRRSQADRAAALAKSRELLLSHLAPAQRQTFERNNWFIVIGGRSEKKYRINTTGYTGNIEEYEGSHVAYRLCGHLRGDMPLHDHHLAQKISLEYDEDAFVRICNRSRSAA